MEDNGELSRPPAPSAPGGSPKQSRAPGPVAPSPCGLQRATRAGRETLLIDGTSAEEFLTVSAHHGLHTWQWRLDTKLQARVSPNGVVGFFDGPKLSPIGIEPVRILDAHGRDITPPRTSWSVAKRNGATWLELTLDDSRLKIPYTIDPTISWRAAGAIATSAGTTINVAVPAAARAQDLLLMQVVIVSASAPTTPAGWTLVTGTGASQAVFWRKAVAGDAGSS